MDRVIVSNDDDDDVNINERELTLVSASMDKTMIIWKAEEGCEAEDETGVWTPG